MADALSQETRIKNGVRQLSVIEPLLFLLFVNDPPSVINVKTLIFCRVLVGTFEGSRPFEHES